MPLDLVGDQDHGILRPDAATGFASDFGFCLSQRVQPGANLFNRLEGQVGQKCGEDQRAEDGDPGISQRGDQPGFNNETQERGTNAHPDGGEWLGVRLHRQGHVVHAGRSEDHLQQAQQAAVLQLGVFLPLGQQVVQIGGIGAHQASALAVRDGHVEDGRRVANGRVQQRGKTGIGAQRLGHCGPQRRGIVRVDTADVGLERATSGKENLVRHHVIGRISLGQALAQKLAKKNPGQRAYHHEYQSGDGEHELGLQSHAGVTQSLLREQLRNYCGLIKDREMWFSLEENHEKGNRSGLHQLRNSSNEKMAALPDPPQSATRTLVGGTYIWNFIGISTIRVRGETGPNAANPQKNDRTWLTPPHRSYSKCSKLPAALLPSRCCSSCRTPSTCCATSSS